MGAWFLRGLDASFPPLLLSIIEQSGNGAGSDRLQSPGHPRPPAWLAGQRRRPGRGERGGRHLLCQPKGAGARTSESPSLGLLTRGVSCKGGIFTKLTLASLGNMGTCTNVPIHRDYDNIDIFLFFKAQKRRIGLDVLYCKALSSNGISIRIHFTFRFD